MYIRQRIIPFPVHRPSPLSFAKLTSPLVDWRPSERHQLDAPSNCIYQAPGHMLEVTWVTRELRIHALLLDSIGVVYHENCL